MRSGVRKFVTCRVADAGAADLDRRPPRPRPRTGSRRRVARAEASASSQPSSLVSATLGVRSARRPSRSRGRTRDSGPASSKRRPSTSTSTPPPERGRTATSSVPVVERAALAGAQARRRAVRSSSQPADSGVTTTASPSCTTPFRREDAAQRGARARLHAARRTSGSVGIASAQSRREATIAPAAFANSTASRGPAREQAVAERAAEGVARAETAHDVDRHRRNERALLGRGDEHAVAARA